MASVGFCGALREPSRFYEEEVDSTETVGTFYTCSLVFSSIH